MPTLYELSGTYQTLLDQLSQAEEISEEQMQQLLDFQDAIQDKLDAYGIIITELTSKTDLIASEKKRLADWQKSIESHVTRMKQAIATILQASQLDKLETPHWRFSFRRSEALEVDEGFVSWAEKYGRKDLLRFPDPAPDKKAIKEAMENGSDMLPARLVEHRSLQIR